MTSVNLVRRASHAALLIVTMMLAACASSSANPIRAPQMKNQQAMDREEIRGTQYTNMYDVINSLRGNWLRVKGPDSFGRPSRLQIYLDGQRLSNVDDSNSPYGQELRSLNPVDIESVRYFDAVQASARWGAGHGAGAIALVTAKR
jgi:TonB-dependent Receptor Plug Domain